MMLSAYYERAVDVMEELTEFTLLTRVRSDYLTDRYSERREAARKREAPPSPRKFSFRPRTPLGSGSRFVFELVGKDKRLMGLA